MYKELTSNVIKISSPVSGPTFFSLHRKSPVSFTKERPFLTIGARKLSAKAEILSVWLSLAETIGLPETGWVPLCILGSRYSSGVRGSSTSR